MPFTFIPEFPPHHRNNGCLTCRVQRRTHVDWQQGGERLIDLGVWVDSGPNGEGQPAFIEVPGVICETCARELASMIGFVEPERGPYKAVADRLTAVEVENQQLRDSLTALQQARELLGGRRG